MLYTYLLPHHCHTGSPEQEFLTKYSESNLQFSDSNINFGRHQILECARDALEKSRENALSKDQVISLCSNLEGTLVEVRHNRVVCTCVLACVCVRVRVWCWSNVG